jgi:release factor glutamine methyltransferase
MLFLKPPGVYSPQDDTSLLAESLGREPRQVAARVLDVGTGSGALALAAVRHGASRVTAVDVSLRAVLTARLNARLSRLPIEVLRGSLLEPVRGRHFELILANPPYVPAPQAHLPRRGAARAWDAGHDGRVVLDRICRDAPALLAPSGVLLLVHSALCGVESTLDRLRESGLDAEVAERRRIPFGPVLRARAAYLEGRGLIRPGEEKEELVVIRAIRSR